MNGLVFKTWAGLEKEKNYVAWVRVRYRVQIWYRVRGTRFYEQIRVRVRRGTRTRYVPGTGTVTKVTYPCFRASQRDCNGSIRRAAEMIRQPARARSRQNSRP